MTFTLISPEYSEADTMRICPICGGTGKFEVGRDIASIGKPETIYYESCPECGGTGKISRDQGARSSLD